MKIQNREPHLQTSLNEEKGPKGPKTGDGDRMRTVKKDDSDEEVEINVSSVSSSESEEEQKEENGSEKSSQVQYFLQ